MKRESKIIEAQKNKKPTLRDDYQNMDIVFANVHRGRKLLAVKQGVISIFIPWFYELLVLMFIMPPIANPTIERIKKYEDNWDSETLDDRRDVIAALRKWPLNWLWYCYSRVISAHGIPNVRSCPTTAVDR